jgi:hypothetical protein
MVVARSFPMGGKDIGLNPAQIAFFDSWLPHHEEC